MQESGEDGSTGAPPAAKLQSQPGCLVDGLKHASVRLSSFIWGFSCGDLP